MQNTKNAFSLIEILVGLIIISVALTAFAPIMNKKVKAQNTTVDTKLTEKCDDWGDDCKLCKGTKASHGFCVQCNKGCNVDQKLDPSSCTCGNDSSGSGGSNVASSGSSTPTPTPTPSVTGGSTGGSMQDANMEFKMCCMRQGGNCSGC